MRFGTALQVAVVLSALPNSSAIAANQVFSNLQVGEMQQIVDQHHDVFGGLAGDPSTNVVTIDIAPSAPSAATRIALAAISSIGSSSDPYLNLGGKVWTIRFTTIGPSLSSLDLVAGQLNQDSPLRRAFGPDLVSYGINPVQHALVVGVDRITPQMQSSAIGFGHHLVVKSVDLPHLLTTRYLDGQPYWGGDSITDTTSGGCTGGFEATDPNDGYQRGMLTAGHCYTHNERVYQGYCNPGCHTTGSMGIATRVSYGNNLVDAEFLDSGDVGTTLQPIVYVNSGTGIGVYHIGSSFIGMKVCLDGSVTGQNCSGVVLATEQCEFSGQFTLCHETEANSSNATRMCQEGDSGGPVYTSGTPGLTAYGLVSLGNTNGQECFYSELYDVLSGLNVAMVFD